MTLSPVSSSLRLWRRCPYASSVSDNLPPRLLSVSLSIASSSTSPLIDPDSELECTRPRPWSWMWATAFRVVDWDERLMRRQWEDTTTRENGRRVVGDGGGYDIFVRGRRPWRTLGQGHYQWVHWEFIESSKQFTGQYHGKWGVLLENTHPSTQWYFVNGPLGSFTLWFPYTTRLTLIEVLHKVPTNISQLPNHILNVL